MDGTDRQSETVISLADRLEHYRGRLPSTCQLLAVSKGQPVERIREAVACGQASFGESRLQEAVAKQEALTDLPPLDWHFIGRLQANKVRAILRHFSTIHSLDSLPMAERLNRIAREEATTPRVFLQVKLWPDPNKTGFSAEELREVWPALQRLEALDLVGLMTMAPLDLNLEERKALFEGCRALAVELGLAELSMGMSGDWPEAVKAGSTWIRLGSSLFGSR
jgi:pyridoxal phosphate enzyme (YggS family)